MSEEHTSYKTQDENSILRKETRTGYTHIANDLCDVKGMSFRAKGIALVLLSKPDNWNIKISYLMNLSGEGEKTIRTALQELAAHGFMMRKRERNDKGHLRTVTLIADYPAYINIGTAESRINGYEKITDLAETDMSVSEVSENGMSVNRPVGNGEVIINTDIPITDIPITDTTTPKKKKDSVADATGRFDFMSEIDKPEPTAEVENGIDRNSGSPNQQQNSLYEEPKPKRKSDAHPGTQPIMDAYVKALGYEPLNYAKEMAAAKKLAVKGYTPADVAAAYDLIKQKPFWRTEHLSLQKVAEQIPALHQALLKGIPLTSSLAGSNGHTTKVDRNVANVHRAFERLRNQGEQNERR